MVDIKKAKKAYQAAIKRDKHQCIICGDSRIALHHVVYRSLGGANIEQNIVCLCHSHHAMIHEQGKAGTERMMEYLRIHYGVLTKQDLKKKGKYSDYAIPN